MFDLSQIKPIKRQEAPKIVVYSGFKAGKTTFASQAPNPIFIQCEKGLNGFEVCAFPFKNKVASSLDEIYDALQSLAEQDHNFATCVIDSIDWMEPLVSEYVCKKTGLKTIGDVSKGYGIGWDALDNEWRNILNCLDFLVEEKGMIIVLIAHSEIKKATPPDSEPYDYLGLKLQKRTAAIVEAWADCTAFINVKKALKKDEKGDDSRKRALHTGIRELICGHNPAYVTGNRLKLPDKMALDFDVFLDELEKATN